MTRITLLAAIFVSTCIACSAPAAGAAAVVFVPPSLDLGEWAAGGAATASVWLINTGETSADLIRIGIDRDGLALRPVATGTIAPTGAREFRITLTADETTGATRTGYVTAFVAGQSPVTLDVSVRSIHPDVHLPPPAADRHAWSVVRATPPALDFGPAAPGETRSQSVWLVNTADTPVRLIAAKGGCGCIQFPDFEPLTIEPRCAAPISTTMMGLGEIGADRVKYTTFVFEDQEPLTVEFWIHIVDPRHEKVRQFIAARERGDTAGMRVRLTLDSRIWYGHREGPGIPRDTDGTAPTAAWDTAMNVQRRHGEFEVGERTISMDVTETNDLHRLAGCTPYSARHTYFFNDDREIDGLLIASEADDDPRTASCLAEFIEWATRRHPRKLAEIYSDGKVTRTVETASLWRAALKAWRRETGRPVVDLQSSPWE